MSKTIPSLSEAAMDRFFQIAVQSTELIDILKKIDDPEAVYFADTGKRIDLVSDRITYVIDQLHDLKKIAKEAELLLEVAAEFEQFKLD